MSVITIHAEETLASAVREYADRLGKSVNAAVKDLLSSALGLSKKQGPTHDFREFCGVLEKEDAEEVRANMKQFESIDGDLWK